MGVSSVNNSNDVNFNSSGVTLSEEDLTAIAERLAQIMRSTSDLGKIISNLSSSPSKESEESEELPKSGFKTSDTEKPVEPTKVSLDHVTPCFSSSATFGRLGKLVQAVFGISRDYLIGKAYKSEINPMAQLIEKEARIVKDGIPNLPSDHKSSIKSIKHFFEKNTNNKAAEVCFPTKNKELSENIKLYNDLTSPKKQKKPKDSLVNLDEKKLGEYIEKLICFDPKNDKESASLNHQIMKLFHARVLLGGYKRSEIGRLQKAVRKRLTVNNRGAEKWEMNSQTDCGAKERVFLKVENNKNHKEASKKSQAREDRELVFNGFSGKVLEKLAAKAEGGEKSRFEHQVKSIVGFELSESDDSKLGKFDLLSVDKQENCLDRLLSFSTLVFSVTENGSSNNRRDVDNKTNLLKAVVVVDEKRFHRKHDDVLLGKKGGSFDPLKKNIIQQDVLYLYNALMAFGGEIFSPPLEGGDSGSNASGSSDPLKGKGPDESKSGSKDSSYPKLHTALGEDFPADWSEKVDNPEGNKILEELEKCAPIVPEQKEVPKQKERFLDVGSALFEWNGGSIPFGSKFDYKGGRLSFVKALLELHGKKREGSASVDKAFINALSDLSSPEVCNIIQEILKHPIESTQKKQPDINNNENCNINLFEWNEDKFTNNISSSMFDELKTILSTQPDTLRHRNAVALVGNVLSDGGCGDDTKFVGWGEKITLSDLYLSAKASLGDDNSGGKETYKKLEKFLNEKLELEDLFYDAVENAPQNKEEDSGAPPPPQ